MLKLLTVIFVVMLLAQVALSGMFSGYATINLGSTLSKRGYHHKGHKKNPTHTQHQGSDNDATGDNSDTQNNNSTYTPDDNSSGSSFSGDGTYFTPDRDACSKNGETSSTSELVAALSRFQFGQRSGQDTDQASMCGKCVKVTGPNGSVVVKIHDLCAPCSSGDIDLTPAAFEHIAPKVLGRVKVVWKPINC